MKNTIMMLAGILLLTQVSIAQRPDIQLPKERKAFAEKSILELKDGVLVVRLKTNQRKIAALQAVANNPKLKEKQRQRHQKMLDNTIATRDAMNSAIANMFLDSFSFCPVYVMYDTSTKSLSNGTRQGIFLNDKLQPDASIALPTDKSIFLVNYKKKSASFPFDVLIMRGLKERLEDPFPYYIPLRASWINNVNTPRAAKSVIQLEKKLKRFYRNTIEKKENE